jgi:ATP-dependent Lhr-like helicase
VLPSRVADYTPALLDELTAAGEVLWSGHGGLPGDDGWIALHPADLATLTLTEPDPEFEPGELHQAVLAALESGGAFFFRPLSDAVGGPDDTELAAALWELTWAGRLTNDTLAPLRARIRGGRPAHRTRRPAPRARYGGGLSTLRARSVSGRPATPVRAGPPQVAGRWSLLPRPEPDATVRAHALTEVLLERHGVLTRGAVAAERVPGGFAAAYRVLTAFEDAGRVRRGYFVEGLGGAQFAGPGAVDRLRAGASAPGDDVVDATGAAAGAGGSGRTVVLAAADPANPYGAALPWPDRGELPPGAGTEAADPALATAVSARPGLHRPGRKAGALVVLIDGELVLYVERGGRSLLSWTEEESALQAAADALALAVREGALGRLTVERADGAGLLTAEHPLAAALARAGFHATPRGLRMRN